MVLKIDNRGRKWTTCIACDKESAAYYRKTTNDYKCSKCKKIFTIMMPTPIQTCGVSINNYIEKLKPKRVWYNPFSW